MNKAINYISSRLSLRKPQRDSLEILANIVENVDLDNSYNSIEEQLNKVKNLYPTVSDFEREFLSLCFSLATGVGKTRLMGAFIAYLYKKKGMTNFFVLAPNLTIYNKLIKDFTPHTSKYVFKGISEFVNKQPVIITGDNFEEGFGVRSNSLFGKDEVHINIFNVSKINTEVRGGKLPRIKRLSEYIGESYFDYLASLPDLVLLMDESHRYRASAGIKVLNELNPILGIELTATPQIEKRNTNMLFKNIVYAYPLANAIEDGFVKEPAVATRENFYPENYSQNELDYIKLEDGIKVHEETKVELELFSNHNNLPKVKPFVLVIAQDTQHASELLDIIKSNRFFRGNYRDKVITIHSNLRGEEKDDTIHSLMALEDSSSTTEIVIHVNMLKEGWDVTNLYTIIPLRAANSKTLVEQSIGRGLRLPYGKRTGIKAVDRLTVIAHDKFQSIIDEANKPDSIIRSGLFIGKDIAVEKKEVILSKPVINDEAIKEINNKLSSKSMYREVDQGVLNNFISFLESTVSNLEYLPNSNELKKPQVINSIINEVKKNKADYLEISDQEIHQIVETYIDKAVKYSIDIPKIVLEPELFYWGYKDFTLNLSNINLQPIDENILIQNMRTHERDILIREDSNDNVERIENLIVHELAGYPDISYDEQADLLYKLASQLIEHLKSYLQDDVSVKNVVFHNRKMLGEFIHSQMKEHYYEHIPSYQAKVKKGFETLKSISYKSLNGSSEINFREPISNKLQIKNMVFSGFSKCLYRTQKFDSDSERRFSIICENDKTVQKWFKPFLGQLKIYYSSNKVYNPDFVVETHSHKIICEIKRADQLPEKAVQEKSNSAKMWCDFATKHEQLYGGKEWIYILIPHDEVTESSNINGLISKYHQK